MTSEVTLIVLKPFCLCFLVCQTVPVSQCVIMKCDPDVVSDMERIVLQVAQQKVWEWQLFRTFCVAVDGEAHQVLQSWEGLWFVQGVHQF